MVIVKKKREKEIKRKVKKAKDHNNFFKILTIVILSIIVIASVGMMLYDYKSYCPHLFSYITVLLFILVLIIFIVAIIEKLKGKKLRIKVKKEVKIKEIIKQDPETEKLLKILDNLLEKLPDKDAEGFIYSKDFELYKKVLKKYKINNK